MTDHPESRDGDSHADAMAEYDRRKAVYDAAVARGERPPRPVKPHTPGWPAESAPRPGVTLTDGSPVTPEHKEIDPRTGQQKGYVVLSVEERAKGFVRPVRRSYRHVGRPAPKHPLRDLTPEETARYQGAGYVKFESYPVSEAPRTGRYWTQAELNAIGRGCGTVTTMAQSIAETYAREPGFYGATFCAGCGGHLVVGEDGEFVWEDAPAERVGT